MTTPRLTRLARRSRLGQAAALTAFGAVLGLVGPASAAYAAPLRDTTVYDAKADVFRVADATKVAHPTDIEWLRYKNEPKAPGGNSVHAVLKVKDVQTGEFGSLGTIFAVDVMVNGVPKYTLRRYYGNVEVYKYRNFAPEGMVNRVSCNYGWFSMDKRRDLVHFQVPASCLGTPSNMRMRAWTETYTNKDYTTWLTADEQTWGKPISLRR